MKEVIIVIEALQLAEIRAYLLVVIVAEQEIFSVRKRGKTGNACVFSHVQISHH